MPLKRTKIAALPTPDYQPDASSCDASRAPSVTRPQTAAKAATSSLRPRDSLLRQTGWRRERGFEPTVPRKPGYPGVLRSVVAVCQPPP